MDMESCNLTVTAVFNAPFIYMVSLLNEMVFNLSAVAVCRVNFATRIWANHRNRQCGETFNFIDAERAPPAICWAPSNLLFLQGSTSSRR
ncbi:hypothetical protein O9992_19500 [Vibrio lentus]|nr:hypothetical protein [Vibrio lentus]